MAGRRAVERQRTGDATGFLAGPAAFLGHAGASLWVEAREAKRAALEKVVQKPG